MNRQTQQDSNIDKKHNNYGENSSIYTLNNFFKNQSNCKQRDNKNYKKMCDSKNEQDEYYIECQLCNKNTYIQQLQSHLKLCEKKYMDGNIYKKSINNIQNQYSKYENSLKIKQIWGQQITICPRCNQKFPIIEIQNHQTSCIGMQIQCPFCFDLFSKQKIQYHISKCENDRILINKLDKNEKKRQMKYRNHQRQKVSKNKQNTLEQRKKIEKFPQKKKQRRQEEKQKNQLQILQKKFQEQEFTKDKESLTIQEIENISIDTFIPASQKAIQDCSICTVEFYLDDFIMTLPCHHIFHPDCLRPWLLMNSHCPICKKKISY